MTLKVDVPQPVLPASIFLCRTELRWVSLHDTTCEMADGHLNWAEYTKNNK